MEVDSMRELDVRVLPIFRRGRRSWLDIKMDVLRVISMGISKPTKIMYAANVSWAVLVEVLGEFVEKGLVRVEEKGERRAYYITEKGADALSKYDGIREAIL